MTEPSGTEKFAEKAQQIRLLVLDVDGVLTDSRLYYTDRGEAMKAFSTQDGQGIKLIQRAGIQVALITAKSSGIMERRARDLGIEILVQNCDNKLEALERILQDLGLNYSQSAYIGDDLPDLACIRKVALGITVPGATAIMHEQAFCSTTAPAGNGAVREICDRILQAQGKYEEVAATFIGPENQ